VPKQVTMKQVKSKIILEDIKNRLDELEKIQDVQEQMIIADEVDSIRSCISHLNNVVGH
jgi:hypothetical protein